jgi:ribose transport system substrate-binding protein
MKRRSLMAATLGTCVVGAGVRRAGAAAFQGVDLARIGPNPPAADQLRAMVAAAMAKTPPRSGGKYIFGYTMWGGSSPFSQLNRTGLQSLCDQAGIDLLVADNEWQPQRNVANAQSFAIRHVDFVINSLLDIQFASAVRQPLAAAGIPIISLDIPIPGTEWVGVNNARAGFIAGTYLAQSAVRRWGAEKAAKANLVIAAFPLVGPNGLLRNLAQEMGARSVLTGLAKPQVTWLDMTGTAESGFAQMNSLLGRLDPAAPLLIASFSDEQLAGALKAVANARRSDMALAVGMGGERLDAVASDPSFIATMSFFPKGYANAAIPTALAMLAGETVPPSVFAYYDLVKPDTVCDADPAQKCRARPDWQPEAAAVDEAAYQRFVAALYQRPDLANFHMLLPPRG